MQHRVPDHQVEGVVVVGDALGVGDPAVDVEPQRLPVAGGDLDHARRQSVTEPRRATPDWIRLRRKKPVPQPSSRAGHRAAEDLVVRDDRVEPAAGVVDAALVVGDRPLFVVALGLPVVIEHLGQFAVVPGGFHLLRGGMWLRCRVTTRHGLPAYRLSRSVCRHRVSRSERARAMLAAAPDRSAVNALGCRRRLRRGIARSPSRPG